MTPPRQPATFKDIQRITGLSLATISKFYNGGNVLEHNRHAIEAAADSLGYQVNSNARSLRSGVSRTVGVLLPTLQNTFHLSVIVEIEKYLRAEGISVLLSSNEGDVDAPGEDAVGLLLGRRVDGIIAVPSALETKALTRAIAAGIPVVAIDWWEPDLDADSVSLDNFGAGVIAGHHLLDHGHTLVGILAGDPTVSTLRERQSGFATALADDGHPLAPELSRQTPLTVDAGYIATIELLATRPRPSAIFAANYELTVGALIAINESGLRLGQDVSMLGFDSVELAHAMRPRLTIITQPVSLIASAAAKIMSDRLKDPESWGAPRSVERLPGSLLVGASVASLRE